MAATQSSIQYSLLDEYLGQLEKVRIWSPRTIAKLEGLIQAEDETALFRLDPLQFASEKNLAEAEAIDLMLHAAKIGLFHMEWHLVCVSCGGIVDSFQQLANLHAHFVCRLCSVENNANLDETIRVGFTINPTIRPLRFHNPQNLTIEELYLHYHLSRQILPYSDGRHLRNILLDVSQIRTFLSPGETREIEVQATPGLLHSTNASAVTAIAFMVDGEAAREPQRIPIQVVNGKFRVPNVAPNPANFPNPSGNTTVIDHVGALHSGPVVFEFENTSEQRAAIWMIHVDETFPTEPLQYTPFLSGKQVLANPTFRDLFRSETIATDEGLTVHEATFLFTDLKGSTEMYEQIGDPQAFFLVRQHFRLLGQVIARNRGAIIKTIGDAVMATFIHPLDALRAALEMNQEIVRFNEQHAARLLLKIGLHRGHSIAVTLNDRIDYFGQTVNIAARVQALAGASEICMTDELYQSGDLANLLVNHQVKSELAAIKGVSALLKIWRVHDQAPQTDR